MKATVFLKELSVILAKDFSIMINIKNIQKKYATSNFTKRLKKKLKFRNLKTRIYWKNKKTKKNCFEALMKIFSLCLKKRRENQMMFK